MTQPNSNPPSGPSCEHGVPAIEHCVACYGEWLTSSAQPWPASSPSRAVDGGGWTAAELDDLDSALVDSQTSIEQGPMSPEDRDYIRRINALRDRLTATPSASSREGGKTEVRKSRESDIATLHALADLVVTDEAWPLVRDAKFTRHNARTLLLWLANDLEREGYGAPSIEPRESTGGEDTFGLERLRRLYDCVMLGYDARDKRWEVECYDYADYETGLRDDGSKPRRSAIIRSGATPREALESALRITSATPPSEPAGEEKKE